MEKEAKQEFELLGETFEVEFFPNLYSMYKNNKTWAEEQLQSVANAWHEGNISSAAIALESDLAHG
jgi:hypothetical protein